MTIITIDQDKCHKDGLCAAVCPRTIISMAADDGFPEPVENAEELCIDCGHCSAVCPHHALRLRGADSAEHTSFDHTGLPSMDQLTQLIRGRRSIRVYRKKPLAREEISEIISLCRYAPTARNSQTLQWLVIDSEKEITALCHHTIEWMRDAVNSSDPSAVAYGFEDVLDAFDNGSDPILREAPGLVLLLAPAAYPLGLIDSTIATTTFELIAASRGIGTCWAGFFMMAVRSWKPLRQALKLPEGYALTTALMVGHPKFRYTTLPERNAPVVNWR